MSETLDKPSLLKRAAAEFLGTSFLLTVVVGSGIMGERLAQGNAALALLANSVATGAGLIFLILTFAPISGAHFNSVVTLWSAWNKDLSWSETGTYLLAQICGAFVGTAIANVMFELPTFFISNKIRNGNAQFFSEFIATFGLLAVIQAGVKFHPRFVPLIIASYITAAYWFTSSTSFANPAVTLGRMVSDTFAGIRPADALPFIIAQFAGATVSVFVFSWLLREEK
ncbi:MAG: MIP/aquaporin family protein [Pyrinomonadaceae bacterium]